MAFLPYILFGYGNNIHGDAQRVTLQLYSDSSPFSMSTGNALTISYRRILDVLTTFPLRLGTIMDYRLQYLPTIRKILLSDPWILSCFFYGIVGFLITLLRIAWTTRRKKYPLFLLIMLVPFFLYMALFPPWRAPWERELLKSFMNEIDLCKRPLVLLDCKNSPINTNRS